MILNSSFFNSAKGSTLHIPAGEYYIQSTLGIQGDRSLHVVCHPDAKFIAASGFPAGAKLFTFNSQGYKGVEFNWTGGQFIGANMPARTADTAPNLMGLFGCSSVRLRGVKLDRTGAGLGGTSLFIAECEDIVIGGCTLKGADDSAIYFSGDKTLTVGSRAKVTDCDFIGNRTGIITKRGFRDTVVKGNTFTDGMAGVVLGGEADGQYLPGDSGSVVGNTFNQVVNAVDFRHKDGFVATGNVVNGVGRSTTQSMRGFAFAMQGAQNCLVTGNVVRQVGSFKSDAFAFLLHDLNHNDYRNRKTENCRISNNQVSGMSRELVNWSHGTNRYEP